MSLLKTLALSLAVLALSFVGTVVLHRALAFNNPSAPPPAGNVPLPLNTSPTTQTKQGPIGATQFQDTDNTLYFFKPAGISKLGGTLNLSSNQIKNVQDPTDPQDVATKAYVDSQGVLQPGQTLLPKWEDARIKPGGTDAHIVRAFEGRDYIYYFVRYRPPQYVNQLIVFDRGSSKIAGKKDLPIFLEPWAISGGEANGKFYFYDDRDDRFFEYDPESKNLKELAPPPQRLGPSNLMRENVIVTDGSNIYNIHQQRPARFYRPRLLSFYHYSPATNSWEALALDLPFGSSDKDRIFMGGKKSVQLMGSKIYFGGGVYCGGNLLQGFSFYPTILVFDTASSNLTTYTHPDSCQKLTNMPFVIPLAANKVFIYADRHGRINSIKQHTSLVNLDTNTWQSWAGISVIEVHPLDIIYDGSFLYEVQGTGCVASDSSCYTMLMSRYKINKYSVTSGLALVSSATNTLSGTLSYLYPDLVATQDKWIYFVYMSGGSDITLSGNWLIGVSRWDF